ncbi:MAG: GH116 family glycosyl-hydrolase [Terriglobales bacterium]
MKNGPSRRDFVKAVVAASFGGVAASAEETSPKSSGSAGAPAEGTRSAPRQPSAARGGIRFPRLHTGRQLARVSCPLGGIGTGGIGLGGRGNLQDWQIFNRADIGNGLQYSFPSLWVRRPGSSPYSVVLERRLLPPYDLHEEGLGSANVPGLPRLAEAKFFGSFPTSRIEFEDAECPVKVALEAFSPFQPLDADASGLPCAVLSYEIHNPGATEAEVVVAWSVSNPVGGSDGRNNAPRTAAGMSGLFMTNPSLAADDPMQGSFVLAALPAAGASADMRPKWRDGWNVGAYHFWFEEFAKTGGLGAPVESSTPVGSVSIRQTIPAGGSRSFRFLLAWHFPNRTPERCNWDAPKGKEKALLGNFYATQFPDAWAVAEHVSANLGDLERRTREFVATLQRSTLPDVVKEAASANLSTLVSNTSFRIADGSFQGFEGCGDRGGLGFGTCAHVWNYEVATQFLFPSLARSMRETKFGYATDAEGHMDFRHFLPPSNERWSAAAADGQMGQIVKLYLDWALVGDDEWLRRQWPAAKRALAYAWRPGGWDERKFGVMDGVQHNTYDVEFYGPNPMCGSWYLAALRATALMADAMGDSDLARDCRRMCEQGSRWIDANLFNGEYYIQQIRGIPQDKIASGLQVGMGTKDTIHPGYQVGDGCQVDQLVGQYMATVAGLGDLLDPTHIRKTLASIYRYNYKRSLMHHASVQRVYALNDEAALVICDYTRGTRPEVPMPYCTEVMTGFEYSAAALMLAYGMVEEGVECIGNIRRRYDGEKANPYDETEYGRHYARAMASWAAIPVLSGFRYNARKGRMDLAPKLNTGGFRCFWSTPAAWGSFEISPRRLTLSTVAGAVWLQEVMIAPSLLGAPGKLKVTSGEKEIACRASSKDGGTLIEFSPAVTVDANRPLRVQA